MKRDTSTVGQPFRFAERKERADPSLGMTCEARAYFLLREREVEFVLEVRGFC